MLREEQVRVAEADAARWLRRQHIQPVAAARNREKAALLYAAIDNSESFYRGWAQPESRSCMNATFRLPTPALEKRFITESTHAGLIGLAGHRTVGGMRASLYNAVSIESVRVLVAFMEEFQRRSI